MSEIAHAVGILPLAWLLVLRAGGVRLASSWWLMAAAFGVSFVADSLAHVMQADFLSQLYLVTQAALFGFAIAPARAADRFVPVLLVAAGVSLGLRQGAGLDLLLHVVAFGGVAWLAWRYVPRGMLRVTLVAGFGTLAVTWCWLAVARTLPAGLAYQGTRIAIAVAWCAAAWRARDTSRGPTHA